MIASQNTLYLTYDKQPRIAKDKNLSHGATMVYTYLYNIYTNSITLKQDNIGQYLTASRKAIAEATGRSVKSVIGYIVELVEAKLIIDRRMGVKEINRIYFEDVEDKYKYDKKQEDQTEEVKIENEGLIKQVKEIISPLENINSKTAKRILMLCDNNFDILKLAAQYMAGRQYDNILGYMSTVIKNRWWESTPKTSNNNHKNKPIKPKGNSTFNKVENHGFNLEILEKKEMLYQQFILGEILETEYKEKLEDLDK